MRAETRTAQGRARARGLAVLLATVLVVAGTAAVVAALSGRDHPDAVASPSSSASATPATAATTSPSASPSPTATAAPTPSATASAQPTGPAPVPTIPGAAAVVTLASYDSSRAVVVVGGFVSGILEDGGTCTFTVTAQQSGATTTVSSVGAINVDSTTCGSQEATPPSSSGSWAVTLTYSDGQGAVTSGAVAVEGR